MLGLFKKTLKIYAPVTGKAIDISEVPDETFSTKLIGNGAAIIPEEGLIVAPVDGQIKSIFRTNHAFGMLTENNIELIVHFGVDTVELNGEGFERLAEEGQMVKVGDPVLKVDVKFVKEKGFSIETSVVIATPSKEEDLHITTGQHVIAGKDVLISYKV